MKKALLLLTIATLFLASCGKEELTPDGGVVLNCVKPAYLKAGDKVALISPAYFTPMENVEATANVLRSWGLVPVIGPNVDDRATLQFNIDGDHRNVTTTTVKATPTPLTDRLRRSGKRI